MAETREQENKLKYFTNNLDSPEEFELLLGGTIGEQISGVDVAHEMAVLNRLGAKRIRLRLNSGGGNVPEGFSIIGAILNSTAEVVTINEGMCASMMGLIYAVGDVRLSYDFSMLMIHDPLFNGKTLESIEDEATRGMVSAVKESLMTVLANNSILTKQSLNKLMTIQKWMNAKEAKSLRFTDKVISTKRGDNKLKNEYLNSVNILSSATNDIKAGTSMVKSILGI